jgi:hypothetical protein
MQARTCRLWFPFFIHVCPIEREPTLCCLNAGSFVKRSCRTDLRQAFPQAAPTASQQAALIASHERGVLAISVAASGTLAGMLQKGGMQAIRAA